MLLENERATLLMQSFAPTNDTKYEKAPDDDINYDTSRHDSADIKKKA
jgi:hypothetical protein